MLESGEGVHPEYVFVAGHFGQLLIVHLVAHADRVDLNVLLLQLIRLLLGLLLVSGVTVRDHNGDLWDVGIGSVTYKDAMLLVRWGFSLNDVWNFDKVHVLCIYKCKFNCLHARRRRLLTILCTIRHRPPLSMHMF